MKKLLCTSLVLLSVAAGTAHAYDEVNNGGGAAERTIVYAYQRLGHYINLCFEASACKVTARERAILQQISYGLPNELTARDGLQFISERQNPGTFIIDGEVKVAKTGSSPRVPIYFNVDLLYFKNPMGAIEAISLGDAVAMLIHEMGHHYGDYTHTELDLLGVKVSMLLQNRMSTTPLLPHTDAISALVINPSTQNGFPEVLLHVYDDVVDLSGAVEDKLKCPFLTIPVPIAPLPDINLGRKKPYGAAIHNVHWEKYEDSDNEGKFSIRANLTNYCPKRGLTYYKSSDFQIEIEFKVRRYSDGQKYFWRFDPKSLDVDQEFKPWWKIIHLPDLF